MTMSEHVIYHSLIGNKLVNSDANSSQRWDNINPSQTDSDSILGHSFDATSEQIVQAVENAQAALEQWQNSGIETRANLLYAIGQKLIDQKQEIGKVLASEEGKTLAEGVGETHRAGQFFQYYAAEALRVKGDFIDSVRPGIEIEVIREPVGVVLAITPWNFPIALPAWKIAPALAYGNCVILKPSELTPACADLLGKIIIEAGVPAGVFQILYGGGEVAASIIDQPIDAISFTGSLATGNKIAQQAAKQRQQLQLEMGGKNALIALADCNVESAVQAALAGAFFGTGQKCTASSRVIIESSIYSQFEQKFIEATAKLKVGHALAAGSQIGPCISADQLKRNQHYLQLAKQEGAQIAYTGSLPDYSDQGYYHPLVVITGGANDLQINQEEIFGPICSLLVADNYEHALELCNHSEFGLTAGIFTNNLKHATHFKRNAKAGCVMVNLPTAGTDYHVPFGGVKSSSFGLREQGADAIWFYTKTKTAYLGAS